MADRAAMFLDGLSGGTIDVAAQQTHAEKWLEFSRDFLDIRESEDR